MIIIFGCDTMRSIMGLELKNVVISPGIDHDKLQSELWLHNQKIGGLYNDGWIDEFYIEFEDTICQAEYMKRNIKYNKKKSLSLDNTEVLIKDLLFVSHSYFSTPDKHLPGCTQITFI